MALFGESDCDVATEGSSESSGRIRLLTHHGELLLLLNENPNIRVAQLAGRLGVSEKTVQRRLTDLVEAGWVRRHRDRHYTMYELLGRAVIDPESTLVANLLRRF